MADDKVYPLNGQAEQLRASRRGKKEVLPLENIQKGRSRGRALARQGAKMSMDGVR